jgi:hypothetical protein
LSPYEKGFGQNFAGEEYCLSHCGISARDFLKKGIISPPVGKVLVRVLLEKGIICPSVGKVSASILLEKGIICPLVGMVLARVCWRGVLFVPLREKDLLASPKVCRKSPMQHAKKLFN